MKRLFFYILIVVSLCGCFKEVASETNFVLRPMVQYVSGDDFEPYYDCVAYAFEADDEFWEVLSWEDARDGVLTSIEDPSVKMYPFDAAQEYMEDGLDGPMMSLILDRDEVMIVVAHTTTEDYGYLSYSVGVNIPIVYGYVRFRTWYEGAYTEGSWIYYSPENEEEESEEDAETEESEAEVETDTEEETETEVIEDEE